MQLYRLIYVSERAEVFDWNDIKEVMLKSSDNNARLEITGLLVLSDRTFLQTLEGPSLELNALYEKIVQDTRHRRPRLLSFTPIAERQFQSWSMRGISLSLAPELAAWLIQKYGAAGSGVLIPDDPWLAFSLLYDVYFEMQKRRANPV